MQCIFTEAASAVIKHHSHRNPTHTPSPKIRVKYQWYFVHILLQLYGLQGQKGTYLAPYTHLSRDLDLSDPFLLGRPIYCQPHHHQNQLSKGFKNTCHCKAESCYCQIPTWCTQSTITQAINVATNSVLYLFVYVQLSVFPARQENVSCAQQARYIKRIIPFVLAQLRLQRSSWNADLLLLFLQCDSQCSRRRELFT